MPAHATRWQSQPRRAPARISRHRASKDKPATRADIGTKVIVVGPGNRQGAVSYNDKGVDFFGNLFGFGG